MNRIEFYSKWKWGNSILSANALHSTGHSLQEEPLKTQMSGACAHSYLLRKKPRGLNCPLYELCGPHLSAMADWTMYQEVPCLWGSMVGHLPNRARSYWEVSQSNFPFGEVYLMSKQRGSGSFLALSWPTLRTKNWSEKGTNWHLWEPTICQTKLYSCEKLQGYAVLMTNQV